MRAKSLQSCLTLCDLMDCSPPGSTVHGIFQARVLEWSAIAFSAHKAEGCFTGKNLWRSVWLFLKDKNGKKKKKKKKMNLKKERK